MHKCKDSFTPELRGKSRFIQHCSNTFTQVPVSPFSHTILLRSVSDSVLTFNASSITEVIKLVGHIFSSLVITKGLYLSFKLIFCPSFEVLEGIKCSPLSFEQIDCPYSRAIVNK